MEKKRFVTKDFQGFLNYGKVIVDTETGVNYLFWHEGNAGGLTPLLNKDGTVVVSRIDN